MVQYITSPEIIANRMINRFDNPLPMCYCKHVGILKK